MKKAIEHSVVHNIQFEGDAVVLGEGGGLTEDRGDLVEVDVNCHLLIQVGIWCRR